jgi:hypothetical protein
MIIALYKKPHTIQELRQVEAIKTDNEIIEATGRRIIVRAKRVNLPTNWDDRPVCIQRSWKVQRLTQYR